MDTLDFSFDCNSPNGMIPTLLFKSDYIVLSQGSGFNYRHSILCSLNNNSTKISCIEYETEIIEPSENDLIFFAKNKFIYLFDRSSKKVFLKSLPNKFPNFKINKFKLYKDKVIVDFDQKDSLIYNLKDF